MVKRIKLMADYNYSPLWDMDEPDNLDPAQLPLKAETIVQLKNWANHHNSIVNWDDPDASGFPNTQDAQAFEQEGYRLWQELQQQLKSDYQVFYFSEQQRQLLEPVSKTAASTIS
jgi:hypothetical protein